MHRAPLFLFIRVSYTPFLEPGSPVQGSVNGKGVVTLGVQTYSLQGLFNQLSPLEIPMTKAEMLGLGGCHQGAVGLPSESAPALGSLHLRTQR